MAPKTISNMRLYRNLAPAPAQDPHAHVSTHNATPSVSSQGSRSSRRRHTAAEWESVKELILGTYSGQTLDETMRIVKNKCGFEAGTRQFKNKLAEWGAEKHFKEDEMRFVSDKHDTRRQQGIPTASLIRGTKIDADRINRFNERLRYSTDQTKVYSPGVTPDGIFYYTPIDNATSPENMARAAHVYSPISRWSNSAASSYGLMKTDAVAAALLGYGDTARKVTVLRIEHGNAASKAKRAQRRENPVLSESDQEREWRSKRWRQKELSKHKPGPEVDASLKRHTHQYGSSFAAASGLFRNMDVLQFLLYEGNNFTVEIMNTLKETLTQVPHSDRFGFDRPVADKAPAYAIVFNSGEVRPATIPSVLRVVQQSKMINRLTSISESSFQGWIGSWQRMNEEEMARFKEVAAAIFGPCPLQGPGLKATTILVRFITDTTVALPSLLRIVLAESCSMESKACRACQDFAVTVDYIGLDGATKFQATQSSSMPGVMFDSFQNLENMHLVKQDTFSSKWTRLANLEQGILPMKHLRQCHCGGSVHINGYRRHFIDMESENGIRHEVWDPMPERDTDSAVYDPFPVDESARMVLVENYLSSDSESDGDHWDPYGQDQSNMEFFDAFPSEDEDNNTYVSKPIFVSTFHK